MLRENRWRDSLSRDAPELVRQWRCSAAIILSRASTKRSSSSIWAARTSMVPTDRCLISRRGVTSEWICRLGSIDALVHLRDLLESWLEGLVRHGPALR